MTTEFLQNDPLEIILDADRDLMAQPGDTELIEAPTFCIDNEAAANWYLKKLANIDAEKQRVQQQAQQIIKQLDSDAERLHYLFNGQLQHFARQTLAAQGNRRKSLTLLQGTCCFRSAPASVKISDPSAALHYALHSLPEAVRTVPALDMGKYRDAAEKAAENGDLLPGVETIPERETFAVRFGKTD